MENRTAGTLTALARIAADAGEYHRAADCYHAAIEVEPERVDELMHLENECRARALGILPTVQP